MGCSKGTTSGENRKEILTYQTCSGERPSVAEVGSLPHTLLDLAVDQ
jgi:hypothetical protein